MRLSLRWMCQMNHKPLPYAAAICWWAQAVLVDVKSVDYGGLILCERGETRTGSWRWWRRGWRAMLPVPALWLVDGSAAEGKGRRPGLSPTPPNRLIYTRLRGINSTWSSLETNKQFFLQTDDNMFAASSPETHGGKTKGQICCCCCCSPLRTTEHYSELLKLLFEVVCPQKVSRKINLTVN